MDHPLFPSNTHMHVFSLHWNVFRMTATSTLRVFVQREPVCMGIQPLLVTATQMEFAELSRLILLKRRLCSHLVAESGCLTSFAVSPSGTDDMRL